MSQRQLYHKYVDAMYSISMNMLNNQQDAEDVLQVSFTNAFSHIQDFNYSSTFGAWLKRIVINNSINSLKKKKIKYVLQDEIHHTAEMDSLEENIVSYSVEQIKAAVAKLPNGYRIVLTLYLIEGYDHTEIAEILDISVSTSKTQYSRAKKKVQEIIKSESWTR